MPSTIDLTSLSSSPLRSGLTTAARRSAFVGSDVDGFLFVEVIVSCLLVLGGDVAGFGVSVDDDDHV